MKKNDIFLIFAQNIDCGYTLEPPQLGGSNEYPQSITKTFPCNKQQIFHGFKKDNFRMKNRDVFLILAQNIDCGYMLEPPH